MGIWDVSYQPYSLEIANHNRHHLPSCSLAVGVEPQLEGPLEGTDRNLVHDQCGKQNSAKNQCGTHTNCQLW